MDAIIPGYDFLSENADFARAIAKAGMVFAGPSPECIEAFGLKHTARDLATKAGVPIVPGSTGLVTSEEDAVKVAKDLGFPVCYQLTCFHRKAKMFHSRLCSKLPPAAVAWVY